MVQAAEVIRRARRRAGLSVEKVAERCDVPSTTIHNWETGSTEPPFNMVTTIVSVCGLDFINVLIEPDADPHDISLLETSLALSVDERLLRVKNYVNFVQAGRHAMKEAL